MPTTKIQNLNKIDAIWEHVSQNLKTTLGQPTWTSWFSCLHPLYIKDNTVVLIAKTSFMCQWIMRHYQHILLDIWQKEIAKHHGDSITVSGIQIVISPPNDDASPTKNKKQQEESSQMTSHDAYVPPIGSPKKPVYRFDNFVVGDANHVPYNALHQLVHKGHIGDPRHNPLCIIGGVGMGKTHLLRATEQALHKRGHISVIYQTADDFMVDFLRALREKTMLQFKKQFHSCNVLLIDDLHLAVGRQKTQEEFSYTINHLLDAGGQLIVSSARPITSLRLDPRLTSRLIGGLEVQLSQPDAKLRMEILQKKNAVYGSDGKRINTDVLEFLAQTITSSVREIEGALKRLLVYNALSSKTITVADAKKILNDLISTTSHVIKMDDIQKCVAKHYDISREDLLSKRRLRQITVPRHVAMYLAKTLTTRSLPNIGHQFGRDHTTVIHAVRRITAMQQKDPTIKEDILILTEMLQEL